MELLCENISKLVDDSIIERLEDKYDINLPKEVIEFFQQNNGGTPIKNEIIINGEEYEVRYFLSFNDGEYNNIRKPLEYFQKQTKGKIVPLATDSGDNYFCLNIENKKVYYWSREDELYYCLANNFNEFITYIK